jgi:hypothetical protein
MNSPLEFQFQLNFVQQDYAPAAPSRQLQPALAIVSAPNKNRAEPGNPWAWKSVEQIRAVLLIRHSRTEPNAQSLQPASEVRNTGSLRLSCVAFC